uniref:Putative ovule protein n=1 Tax=Solanum chacoense TaxID=4108 RepID=A0A0V0GJ65_SOLCH
MAIISVKKGIQFLNSRNIKSLDFIPNTPQFLRTSSPIFEILISTTSIKNKSIDFIIDQQVSEFRG